MILINFIRGHEEVMQVLITAGCEINHQDLKNNSALHYACLFNHIRAVEVLLARKSLNLNLKNIDNKLP
jgi:ankyrin repeat protein